MVPEVFGSRPTMVRRVTDLPEPEGPMMPNTSPRRTSRLNPSMTMRSPKPTTRSRMEMMGSGSAESTMALNPYRRKEHREQPIGDDDEEDGANYGGRSVAAQRFGAAFYLEAFIGGDQPDDQRHGRRLDQ